MNGRAETTKEKKKVVKAMLDGWKAFPELRLGQMLNIAITRYLIDKGAEYTSDEIDSCLFYIEDEKLAGIVAKYTEGQ